MINHDRPRKTAWPQLVALLRQGPPAAGFATDLWTLERVAQVIERHFGVKYHPGHVWYLLRDLGWSLQKPDRRARERDEMAGIWMSIVPGSECHPQPLRCRYELGVRL